MIALLRRLRALIAKEFLAIWKDPKSRFIVIGPPVLQFILFGYAATFDVTSVNYAVYDQSQSVHSRELLSSLQSSDAFHFVGELQSPEQVETTINNELAAIVIQIQSDFEDRLTHEGTAAIQVIADGRNSNVAAVALGYIGRIVSSYNLATTESSGQSSAWVDLQDRAWFNPNLLSRWYIVGALPATIGMVIVLILASLSVAREREFGTFDQLMVAPFRPWEILVGKAMPGILFGFAEGLILSVGSVYWFGVPFEGSMLALFVTLLLFFIAIVGLGLLISSVSTTMQQGLLGAFIFIMPAVILSGFTTSIQNMPEWLQYVTFINPLRYAVTALRQVFLEGGNLAFVWPQLWPMMLIACVTLPAAAWMFRHRSQ
jgi:ABC-2 type transport system permease protein